MVTARRKSGRRRRRERGAAVFIVVMVISLLTAIGVFAARSASLADMATGYDRQAVQTRLASDYAGRLAVAELGTGNARTHLDRYHAGKDLCASNLKATPLANRSTVPCTVLTTEDIKTLIAQRSPGQTVFGAQTTSTPGSLGPQLGAGNASSAMEGLMRVEIIDAFAGETAPGSPANGGFMDVQFTLTAYAQLRNTTGSDAWCVNTATASGASVQALRAHVTVPNITR
jgi:hypothetical protein